jgi:light-harvesting complex I chlorophyll a/b binding protein 2
MAAMAAAHAVLPAIKNNFVSGQKLRAAKVAAAQRTISLTVRAERPLFFPGNPAPAYLDGSLPGDYGFDPLGLGSVPSNFKWYVQAELVHCRWAMLGAAGILIPDVLRTAGILNIPRWDVAGVAEYPIGLDIQLIVLLFAMGFAEGKRWADINNPGSVNQDPIFSNFSVKGKDLGYPGFDPLSMGQGDASYLKNIRTKEIANGRLAMIACLGFFIQAAYTDKSPVENLLEHVADPFHNNLIESLFN